MSLTEREKRKIEKALEPTMESIDRLREHEYFRVWEESLSEDDCSMLYLALSQAFMHGWEYAEKND